MTELQRIIGYEFQDLSILSEALTHSSYSNEVGKNTKCNERLEFLGDSVLSLVVTNHIFNNYSQLPEGDLTKLRAALVCEKTLYKFAKLVELGKFIKLSRGERHGGGADRPSILSDAFEALIAAIFLDGGYDEAKKFVMTFIEPEIKNMRKKPVKDYKTTLQEIVQKNPGERLEYRLISESGPDHNKHFVSEVLLNSNSIGKGGGRSKKEAEQQAAREALELMGY
ncbi:MAG: ribonuclease III [Clostridia bacterium]|nr:ribonuclease III [Clostridia bacterium]